VVNQLTTGKGKCSDARHETESAGKMRGRCGEKPLCAQKPNQTSSHELAVPDRALLPRLNNPPPTVRWVGKK